MQDFIASGFQAIVVCVDSGKLDASSAGRALDEAFLRDLPPELRRGYRLIDFAVIRPSQDLGKLAAEYEPQLPRAFRFLTRSLGTRETSNADFMSLFMFVPGYLQRLIEIGEADAEAKIDAITRVATAA